ncbi:hypothetical protein MSG28_010475 [Choristoneura fumiferana]|uniref:Uncharacterized protein n=1 Tax=Choristoneura fumiferana TaxID=7141 RepID=A0ACC0KLF6_CHOFU|nr:hypothetical protein MSG28_010475 [Choristoneura fumiferana]
MDLNYDELFKISIWALKINRSYPTIPNDKIWFLTMIPMHGFFFFIFCLLLNSTICHDLKNNNFSAACTNGIFAVLFFVVTFNYTVLFIKKHDIITAIKRVKRDYEAAKLLPEEEQAIVVQYAKAANWLEIVKFRISNLFNGGRYEPKEIRERLKHIVMPLQEILEFVHLLKETFRVIYEVYMKATTIVFPIAFYEIIESFKEGHGSFEYMTFIVAGSVLCFASCYYSDLLMEKGDSVRLSVYTSGWECHPDSGMRRTLLITLSRLERDVAIRTLFRTVNLDAFSEASLFLNLCLMFLTPDAKRGVL